MTNEIALILFGAAITLVAQFVKNLSDRETHASNRVLEMRLAALRDIWHKYSVAMWEFGPSASLGWQRWHEQHGENAAHRQNEFRKELEKNLMILDYSIISEFRKIDSELLLFRDGDRLTKQNRPISYSRFLREHLNPQLDRLADAINKAMDASTHKIELRFRDTNGE